jgi:hypothetical protein
MDSIPLEIQKYGFAGLLVFLIAKEALKPLLESFIKGKEKEQDLMTKVLTEAVTRIPDSIEGLNESLKVFSMESRRDNKEFHELTHKKLDSVSAEVSKLSSRTADNIETTLNTTKSQVEAIYTCMQRLIAQ